MLTLITADLADERPVDEAWLKRWGWYECHGWLHHPYDPRFTFDYQGDPAWVWIDDSALTNVKTRRELCIVLHAMCAAPLRADARKMIEKIALDRAAKLGGDLDA